MQYFRSLVFACPLLAAFAATPAHATEDGKQHFPIGLQTAVPALLPEDGHLEFYNYDFHYTADRLNDGTGNQAVRKFNLNVAGTAERILYTYPVNLGNLSVASGGAVNILHQSLKVDGAHSNNTSLGDLNVEPLIVNWSNKKGLWLLIAPNVWAPTGGYNVNRLANAGLNYWSLDMEVAVTWMPSQKWEFSADTFTGVILTANHATNYRSGNTFSSDLTAGYRPLDKHPQFQVALQGNVFTQVTDDEIEGVKVGIDGYRGQEFALGPQLRWDFSHKTGVLVKYQREFAVENRPKGDKLWFEFIAPIL